MNGFWDLPWTEVRTNVQTNKWTKAKPYVPTAVRGTKKLKSLKSERKEPKTFTSMQSIIFLNVMYVRFQNCFKVWSYQNFPGISSMIFSETIRVVSRRKFWNISSGVLRNSQTLETVNFSQKAQSLATDGKVLAISKFYQSIHYNFLKKDHKGSFDIKYYENFCSIWKILVKNSHWTVKAVAPEMMHAWTHVLTHIGMAKTHKREYIGSISSSKTSWELIIVTRIGYKLLVVAMLFFEKTKNCNNFLLTL